MNKCLFEKARKLYPGRKRGFEYEWDNFRRKYGMKLTLVCPLLTPAIERQIAYREKCKANSIWCPQWKNFPTWINGGWWTEEIPQDGKPKRVKCKCGKPATHSIFVYFEDGAKTIYRCDDCPDPEPDWRKRKAATDYV